MPIVHILLNIQICDYACLLAYGFSKDSDLSSPTALSPLLLILLEAKPEEKPHLGTVLEVLKLLLLLNCRWLERGREREREREGRLTVQYRLNVD